MGDLAVPDKETVVARKTPASIESQFAAIGDSFEEIAEVLSSIKLHPDTLEQMAAVSDRLEELGLLDPDPAVDEEALLRTLRVLESFAKLTI